MRILYLIQSFIPKEKQQDYFSVLTKTIDSVKNQRLASADSFDIALCDDGSDYLAKYATDKITLFGDKELNSINELISLDLKYLALISNSVYYNKGALFNFVLQRIGKDYDIIFVLDDDHPFFYNDSLERVIKHFKRGFNFVVGRLYFPKEDKFRCYYDNAVQGTTFAISYDLLKKVDFWSDNVKEWGCGEDSEIFWKVYNYFFNYHSVMAIYDGNIITEDCISDRWLYCMTNVGGRENFKISFKNIYGVDPHQNEARNKKSWLKLARNEVIKLPELFFLFLKKSEYEKALNSKIREKIYYFIWVLKSIKYIFAKKIRNVLRGVINANNR